MKELILLYWGCIFLMAMSQIYYPVRLGLDDPKAHRSNFLRRKADIFMVIVIAWMTCVSFLRTNYNDTWNYIQGFANAPSIAEGLADGTFTDWTGNPWSMLYRCALRSITDNYHIYFFFPAFLSSFAVVKMVKRYSVTPGFSMMIFFSVGTYVLYIAALKQCFAMFFLIMALPYAIEKKYLRFYLLVTVAVLFHVHAFMFAIVPLLLGKPWGKRTWLLLAAVLFATATYDVTMGKFMEIAQSVGAYVTQEELFDGYQINALRVMVYWVPALLALVFRKRLFRSSTQTENLFVNMSIVSAFILTMGLVEGANLYARMAGYFEVATAIALPWMIKKLFTKESAQFVTIVAGVCYFGYFLFEFGVAKDFGHNYSAITLGEFFLGLF